MTTLPTTVAPCWAMIPAPLDGARRRCGLTASTRRCAAAILPTSRRCSASTWPHQWTSDRMRMNVGVRCTRCYCALARSPWHRERRCPASLQQAVGITILLVPRSLLCFSSGSSRRSGVYLFATEVPGALSAFGVSVAWLTAGIAGGASSLIWVLRRRVSVSYLLWIPGLAILFVGMVLAESREVPSSEVSAPGHLTTEEVAKKFAAKERAARIADAIRVYAADREVHEPRFEQGRHAWRSYARETAQGYKRQFRFEAVAALKSLEPFLSKDDQEDAKLLELEARVVINGFEVGPLGEEMAALVEGVQ